MCFSSDPFIYFKPTSQGKKYTQNHKTCNHKTRQQTQVIYLSEMPHFLIGVFPSLISRILHRWLISQLRQPWHFTCFQNLQNCYSFPPMAFLHLPQFMSAISAERQISFSCTITLIEYMQCTRDWTLWNGKQKKHVSPSQSFLSNREAEPTSNHAVNR